MVGEYVLRRKRSRYNAKTRLQEMTKKVREELNNDTSTSEESNIQNEIDEDYVPSTTDANNQTANNQSTNNQTTIISNEEAQKIAMDRIGNNGYLVKLKPFENNLLCLEFYGLEEKIGNFSLPPCKILRNDWIVI